MCGRYCRKTTRGSESGGEDPGAGWVWNLIPQNRVDQNRLYLRVSNGAPHPTGQPLSSFIEIRGQRPILSWGADFVGPANAAVLRTKIGGSYIDFSDYFAPTSTATGFLGVVSSTPFTTIRFEARTPASEQLAEAWQMDNLSIATAVPEPSMPQIIMALMVGLAVFTFVTRT